MSKGVSARSYSNTIFVCAKFTDADGNVFYSQVINYSPEGYAASQLSKTTVAESAKEVCRRMVIYGEAARLYFGED